MFQPGKVIRFLIVFFCILTSSVNAQDIPFSESFFPDKPNELKNAILEISKGDDYFTSGNTRVYKHAITFYENASRFNGSNADLNFKLGACYIMARKKQLALEHLKKAIQLNPEVNPEVHFYLGYTNQLLLLWNEAISEYSLYAELIKNQEPVDNIQRRIEECRNGIELVKKPVQVKIENLGLAVNSKNAEYSPLINADESSLFFTSRRSVNGIESTDPEDLDYYEDIFTSDKVNNKWSPARNLGPLVNTPTHDASAGLSLDGHILFVFKGDRNNGDILMSYLDKGEWTKPVDPGKNINTKFHESSACLSPDGNILYLSSDKPGGYGGRDIYISKWNPLQKLWGAPINAGKTINTPYDEEGIYMHPSGTTIYFSSKGHNSMGGYDVFYSTITNGIFNSPVNIGYPVNTPDDDVYFAVSADGNRAYYASVIDEGYGEKDLYQVTFLSNTDKPLSSMSVLKGYILDEKTHQPLTAHIELIDLNKQEKIGTYTSDSKTGKYIVSLPSGRKYGAFVYVDGYLFESNNFDIPDSASYKEIVMDMNMKSIDEGNNIILNNIFFDLDNAQVQNQSTATLLSMVRLMKEYTTLKVEISGHTDSDGSDDYNMKLSENRSKNVVEFLVSNGIEASRLTYKGYGESKPLYPNDSNESKAKNRRIEFRITSK
jgi:outer membrane protein OmpA-like peptidoglycan-associated protein